MLADDKVYKNTEDIYRLLVLLRQDVRNLELQIRSLRNESKGDERIGEHKS